jgi:hypothetical protein
MHPSNARVVRFIERGQEFQADTARLHLGPVVAAPDSITRLEGRLRSLLRSRREMRGEGGSDSNHDDGSPRHDVVSRQNQRRNAADAMQLDVDVTPQRNQELD